MTQIIEDTVKALTEFESALDRVKSEAADAKRRMMKSAGEWAESAKSRALAEAQKIAAQRLSKAKQEAEAEAAMKRERGLTEMKRFEGSISKRREEAGELVARRLLGEK